MSTTPRPPLLSRQEINDAFMYGPLVKDAAHGFVRGANYVQDIYEAARAKDAEEIAKWKGIVKGVHGALTDIGTVPVPAMDADLYDAVMSIRAKDAELIQRLVDALKRCDELYSHGAARAYEAAQHGLAAAAAAGFTPTEP